MEVSILKQRVEGSTWKFFHLAPSEGLSLSASNPTNEIEVAITTSNGSIYSGFYKPGTAINFEAPPGRNLSWQPLVTTDRSVFFALEHTPQPQEAPNPPAEEGLAEVAPRAPIAPPRAFPIIIRPRTDMRIDLSQNRFVQLLNRLATEPSPRLIFKKRGPGDRLASYFVCLPKSIVPPKYLQLCTVPFCPRSLNIVQFKPSCDGFKFIYNHLLRANTAHTSPWYTAPDGLWHLLSWRLADHTFFLLIQRVLKKEA